MMKTVLMSAIALGAMAVAASAADMPARGPAVSPALLVGGGIRGGRVLGETDRWGGAPLGGAVTFKDVTATIWHCLGIDPQATTLTDVTGRPHPLIDRGRILSELL